MSISTQATQGQFPGNSVTLIVMSTLHIFTVFSFVILETGKHLHLMIQIKWLKQIKEKKVVIFLGKMRLSVP